MTISLKPPWLRWVQQLQATAQTGLTFAGNPWDRERYEGLLGLAAEMAAEHTNASIPQVRALFETERGYATPKVEVRGAVFRGAKILLVRELTDGLWSLPGGWADVGDTPAEAIEREIREETGLAARVRKVIGVFDRDRQGHPPSAYSVYKLLFACELLGGELTTSYETPEVAFFAEDELPPLSTPRVTAAQIGLCFAHLREPDAPTAFD